MKVVVLAVVLAAASLPSVAHARHPDPYGCEKTYTRAHFHAAAHSTYRTAFPSDRKLRTLARVVRCQRRVASRSIVRRHLRRYRAAWAERFYFEHAWAAVPAWLKSKLASIASCESGGDPGAVSNGGKYRGKYQFDYGTWGEVGGHGDPADAPELEQDVRAAWLYLKAGWRRWPVCGA